MSDDAVKHVTPAPQGADPSRADRRDSSRSGRRDPSGADRRDRTLETGRILKAFLVHMRHELRTPISAIIGYSEMLLEDATGEGGEAFVADLQKIHMAGNRLLAHVNEIMDAPAKLEAGQLDISLDPVSAHLHHEMRTLISAIIGYSEMLLEDAADGGGEAFVADLQKIRAAAIRFLALIDNLIIFPTSKTGEQCLAPLTANTSAMIQEVVATIRPLEESAANKVSAELSAVLVVDDNEINRDVLSRRLERQGYAVTVAEDGRRALEMLATQRFELVLLDILMPEMNGYQVLQRMNTDPALRDIPVIMISELDEPDSVVRCIEMGAEDYLPMPFNPVLLRARINASLEKKRLRDEMRELNKKLEERVQQLQSQQEELRQSNEAKSQFMAHMSHEIRTPMNGVMGFLKLLAKTELTEQQRDYLHTTDSSARTLLTVINDILDFSKIEAGKLSIENVAFDSWELIEEAVSMFAANAEEKGLALICVIGRKVPRCLLGDPSRLSQVLSNLLSNAIKFTERGEVRVAVHANEETDTDVSLQISVTDTGIGISEEALARLFQPFSQADSSTTRKYGGTGLGLIISKKIVEMCGGSIEVESRAGHGTCCIIRLRLHKQADALESMPLPAIMAKLSILIITPNPGIAEGLAENLSAWGIASKTVSSGTAALNLLKENADTAQFFHAVIYDQAIVDTSSREFAVQVKASSNLGEIPLLMLCKLSTSQREAQQEGYVCFISKPAKSPDLYNHLCRLFDCSEKIPYSEVDNKLKLKPLIGKRALIVDDNDINRKLAQLLIVELGGKFDSAENGVQAVEACTRLTYDVILMDVNMPVMDGLEATQHIRNLEAGKSHTPIIALTANALSGDKEKFIAKGMDDYLSKPINEKALLGILHRFFPQELEQVPNINVVGTNNEETGNTTPALDPVQGVKLCFGDANNWHLILGMLLDDLQDYSDKIKLASQDMTELSFVSHKLAGSACYCGTPALYQAAKQVEIHCTLANFHLIDGLLFELQQQIDRLLELDACGQLRGSEVVVY